MAFFINLSLALLTAHLLGDFVFQTTSQAARKKEAPVLLQHAAIHAALAYLLVGRWDLWAIPAAVFVTHSLIDFCKARLPAQKISIFILDQAAHLAVIGVLAAVFGHWGLGAWTFMAGNSASRIFLIASGGIVCVRVPAFLIGFWVQPYLDEIQRNEPRGSPRGLVNGGRVIGQWERGLIFIFVLIGQPGAIGFLIAAKSIFRFGELKDRQNRMEAEYITIGTLMSFGLAAAVATITELLIRRL